MPLEWPEGRKLRTWQRRAFDRFMVLAQRDFLLVATPGAGKTTAALRCGFELMRIGTAQRVIVVCPTEHLKYQWADAAAAVGINVLPEFVNSSGSFASDYHGVAVTYAQVASCPQLIRHLCSVPTFAIIDEIHHAGTQRSWGDGIAVGLEPCAKRLALSGTPFRETPMPFVTYDRGSSVADFSYTYTEALRDGVCRPVLFPSYEGNMKWYSRGNSYEAAFSDPLAEEQMSKRLRTAVDASGDWIKTTLRDANDKLTAIRETHPTAGGLILGLDQSHAQALYDTLRRVTGECATVVVSDEARSNGTIEEFANGRSRWAIAVKMISEGSDIPRLRVGVYATTTTAPLFFRQVVGRFVRMLPDLDEQNAYVFIPSDPRLVAYAQEIKKERDHQLAEEIAAATNREQGQPTDDRVLSTFLPISSTGVAHDLVMDGEKIPRAEADEAIAYCREFGVPEVYEDKILMMLRKARGGAPLAVAEPPTRREQTVEPLHQQKRNLCRLIKRAAATIIARSDGNLDWQKVNGRLMRLDGLEQGQCSLDQLRKRLEFLQECLKNTDSND